MRLAPLSCPLGACQAARRSGTMLVSSSLSAPPQSAVSLAASVNHPPGASRSVVRTEAVEVDRDEIAAVHRTQALPIQVVKLALPLLILLLQPADGLCEQRSVGARSAQLGSG